MFYIVLFLTSVFISSVSQILLKRSADKKYDSKLAEYINVRVIVAYILFFGSTLLTVIAYREVPLSLGPILESVGYIFVAILSFIFLKEKFEKRRLAGLLLIVIGVIISNIK